MSDSQNRNTIIVHDTFLYRGGGERLVMYMREILDCDLASGFFDPGSYTRGEILRSSGASPTQDAITSKQKYLGNPKLIELTRSRIFTKGIRHIKLKLAFLHRTSFLRRYDTVIFSGDCLASVRNVRDDARKIFYCHTPPRYIFDKREWYENQIGMQYRFLAVIIRPIYRWVRGYFERSYRRDIAHMDVVIANSREVQKRIQTYFGIHACVLYPPVNLGTFSLPASRIHQIPLYKKYYLSFGRLAEFKRVHIVIEAFRHMSDKQLIVTYGRNDPIKDRIIRLARGLPNVQFRTDVDDEEAIKLLHGAIATIYIPQDEDFGMVPIESMACGTPVIGVDEGGLRETILSGETGILIEPRRLYEGLMEAVGMMDSGLSVSQSDACRQRARDFSFASFQTKLLDIVGEK